MITRTCISGAKYVAKKEWWHGCKNEWGGSKEKHVYEQSYTRFEW
jgi:hypothetical protein